MLVDALLEFVFFQFDTFFDKVVVGTAAFIILIVNKDAVEHVNGCKLERRLPTIVHLIRTPWPFSGKQTEHLRRRMRKDDD